MARGYTNGNQPRTGRRRFSRRMRDRSLLSSGAVYRPPTFGNTRIHRFTRSMEPQSILSSTISTNFQSYSFELSDLPGYTEFTALYDQYKIDKVHIRIVPAVTQGTPADPLDGFLVLAVDYDDATNPASISALMENHTAQVLQAGRETRLTIVPRLANAVYNGAFTGYGNSAAQWLDAGSPSVQHYGFKVGISQTTVSHRWYICFTYELSFRSSR